MDGQKDKATGQGNIKKLFQYLKNSRTDQQGIPPLNQSGNLHTETKKGKHIKPTISVCVYTLGPTFITRAFSHESARPCG